MVSYKALIERWILPSLLEIEGNCRKELKGELYADFWVSKYSLEDFADKLASLTSVMQNADNKLKARNPNGTRVSLEKDK